MTPTVAAMRIPRRLFRSATTADRGIVAAKNSTPIICNTRNCDRGIFSAVVAQLNENTVIR